MNDRLQGVGRADQAGRRDDDDVRMLDFGQVLFRRKNVVFAVTGLVVILATILTIFATPQFQSTATLQIERQIPEVLDFKSALSSDGAGSEEFLQTQYMILQSNTVLEAAVARVDLLHRPEYAGRRRSPVRRALDRVSSWLSGPGQGAATTEGPNDRAVEYLAKRVSIKPVTRSHLVRVSVTDHDALLSADLANAVVAAYQQFNLDTRYMSTAQASEFLSKQVVKLQSELTEKERQLQDYGSTKDILTLRDETQTITSSALADLSSRYVMARGNLAVSEAQFDSVREIGPDALPEVLNSPLITHLKQQYAQIERRHSQMSERFGVDWPPMQQLSSELMQARDRLEMETQAIANQVRSSAEADYRRALAETEYLRRQVEQQKREVRRVNRDAGDFGNLKAEIENKRSFLSEMVNRQSESQVSDRLRNTATSNVRVVDPAKRPNHPIRPRRVLNILLSVILGFGLGLGAAMLVDHLDYTVKHEQDVERLTALPIIGQIPLLRPRRSGEAKETNAPPSPENAADLASHIEPRSAFAEAFKNMRTSLLLASAERPPQQIVITSCEPRDGKSTVSLNLAIVLTQLGRRVLLIDADLRLPRVHSMLGISNEVGLAHYLAGTSRFDDLPRPTDVPGLDVITSGPAAPTPSELLDSPGLRTMLERLSSDGVYDHVIFDCPPALQVADSVILAARVDATIVVVRREKTAREAVRQTVSRLRHARAKLIGTVFNGVPQRGGAYYGGYADTDRDDDDAKRSGTRPWHRRRTGTG